MTIIELEDEGITTEEEGVMGQIKETLDYPERVEAKTLRQVDRKKLRETSMIIDSVISRVKTKNIIKTDMLVLAGARGVADPLIKKKKASRDNGPWWRKSIPGKIREQRKDISKLDQWNKKKFWSKFTMSKERGFWW